MRNDSSGMTLAAIPTFWTMHTQCETDARAAMSADTFADAYQHGRVLSVAEAVQFALGEQRVTATPRADSQDDHPLTRRELQIAERVADGLSNQQIASQLVISRRTVETHVENVLRKPGFGSRAQIASWFVE
jgi:DNA-binding NarL/FixJ family response regulator